MNTNTKPIHKVMIYGKGIPTTTLGIYADYASASIVAKSWREGGHKVMIKTDPRGF